MSDEALTSVDHLKMALVARNLAGALLVFARERREEDRKRIAELQTELCTLYREEQKRTAPAPAEEEAPP